MAFFSGVPVVDVHTENFKLVWPSLMLAINSSSYVALDAELSGLGNRRNLQIRSMEDRYQSLANVARTRSILSLGVSCFKVKTEPKRDQGTEAGSLGFLVQTFNITTLCSEDYTVEPGSLKFLVDHGFDFNKQYSLGLPYHRGLDRPTKDDDNEDTQTLRVLFSELIKSNKPIVFHNGFVDLVFLYQNFYSELPASSLQFVADLCEIFRGGIFDTKYLAEFQTHMHASYLEYVFRKSQRENARHASSGRHHIALEFCKYEEGAPFIEHHHCPLPVGFTERPVAWMADSGQGATVELCEIYAAHGHCKDGVRCSKSHDPDAIQDAEDKQEERRKRKRKRKQRKYGGGTNDEYLPDGKREKGDDAEECHSDGDSYHGNEEEDEAVDKEMELNIESVNGGEKDGVVSPISQTSNVCASSTGDGLKQTIEVMDSSLSRGDKKDVVVSPTPQTCNAASTGEEDLKQTEDVSESSLSRGETVNGGEQDRVVSQTPQTHNAASTGEENLKQTVIISESSLNKLPKQTGGHRAGYDAFMTGFVMATLASSLSRQGPVQQAEAAASKEFVDAFKLSEFRNKLFLSGKQVPLLIAKSGFARTSQSHKKKMKSLGMIPT